MCPKSHHKQCAFPIILALHSLHTIIPLSLQCLGCCLANRDIQLFLGLAHLIFSINWIATLALKCGIWKSFHALFLSLSRERERERRGEREEMKREGEICISVYLVWDVVVVLEEERETWSGGEREAGSYQLTTIERSSFSLSLSLLEILLTSLSTHAQEGEAISIPPPSAPPFPVPSSSFSNDKNAFITCQINTS